MNIVGNAIKFTENGSVKVLLDGKLADERGNYIICATVKDTGIGISPDKLTSLFQPFFQAEESMSRRFGGTGLGLYITKYLCEAMGGNINIISTLGKGSTVHFEINLVIPGKLHTYTTSKLGYFAEVPDILPPLNILLAEDNPVNQLVIKTMLERSGCSVTLANNGIEAIKSVKEKGPYDLIIMDGSMPEMDGLEATRQIRKFSSDLPIIGLTAHAMITDQQRFLESGMNGYLAKPVNKKVLNAEILRCLQKEAGMQ
jgi:CheY-like chemotaxis protein